MLYFSAYLNFSHKHAAMHSPNPQKCKYNEKVRNEFEFLKKIDVTMFVGIHLFNTGHMES